MQKSKSKMGRWVKCVERLRSNHAFLLLGLSAKSSYDASVFAGRGNEASDSSVRGGIPIAGVDREGGMYMLAARVYSCGGIETPCM